MSPISGQEEMKRKARVRRGRRSGGLLDPDKPKIMFTNPDILFLILGLQYHVKRAVGLTWNDKLEMLTIKGIGKYRRVHASEIFSDDDCGMIHETQNWPQLRLYQDGESTPVSDLIGRQNHIFTVVPKVEVESQADWRLAVFEAGRYLVAFDGAALLLLELWKKTKEAVTSPKAMSQQ